MQKPSATYERARVISFFIMTVIAGLGLVAVLIALGLPDLKTPLHHNLKSISVPITLAIAANQMIHQWPEIQDLKGLDGLATAVTKVVAPFAVVILAMALAGVNPWALLGLSPFAALVLARLNGR